MRQVSRVEEVVNAATIPSGNRIYFSGNAATPQLLLKQIGTDEPIRDIELYGIFFLGDIKKLFSDVPFIIVENKVDIKNTSSANQKISCTTGEGIEQLRQEILSILDKI